LIPRVPSTKRAPAALAMPGFAGRLSDAEVAELVNFIRGAWTNDAGAVDAQTVGKVRAQL
jgi:alcohol dehydrogenase (quinone), cytochrome c subunit